MIKVENLFDEVGKLAKQEEDRRAKELLNAIGIPGEVINNINKLQKYLNDNDICIKIIPGLNVYTKTVEVYKNKKIIAKLEEFLKTEGNTFASTIFTTYKITKMEV